MPFSQRKTSGGLIMRWLRPLNQGESMGIDMVVELLAKKGLKAVERQNQPRSWDFEATHKGPFKDISGCFTYLESGYPDKAGIWLYPNRKGGLTLAKAFLEMGFETVSLNDDMPVTGGKW